MQTLPAPKFRAAALSLVLATFAANCGGGGKDQTQGLTNSPTAPGSTVVNGVWTGTLTRPNGAGTMTLRWETAAVNMGLSGPMTLTNSANVSLTIKATGTTSGNDSQGYKIRMTFDAKAGENSNFPACSVTGNTQDSEDPFPSPYNKITIASFKINFFDCKGFIEPPPQRTSVEEVVQLSLSK